MPGGKGCGLSASAGELSGSAHPDTTSDKAIAAFAVCAFPKVRSMATSLDDWAYGPFIGRMQAPGGSFPH
jgi:hypothetical protein